MIDYFLLQNKTSVLFFLLFLSLPFSFSYADRSETLYFEALKAFEKGQWLKAKKKLKLTLKLLAKKHPTTRKKKVFLTLGRCDIFYHLARIEEELKHPRHACRIYQNTLQVLSKLPPEWIHWRINRLLPIRFEDARKRFEKCGVIPSILDIRGLPPKTRIFWFKYFGSSGKKSLVEVHLPLKTTRKKFLLIFRAPHYLEHKQEISLPRWHRITLTIHLKPKPKPRKPTSRPALVKIPKHQLPPPKQGDRTWLWIGVGVGVLAASTAVTFIVLSQQKTQAIQPVIVGIR